MISEYYIMLIKPQSQQQERIEVIIECLMIDINYTHS